MKSLKITFIMIVLFMTTSLTAQKTITLAFPDNDISLAETNRLASTLDVVSLRPGTYEFNILTLRDSDYSKVVWYILPDQTVSVNFFTRKGSDTTNGKPMTFARKSGTWVLSMRTVVYQEDVDLIVKWVKKKLPKSKRRLKNRF
jgi:hypothetical protein